jgi:ribonuclease HI
MAKTKRLVYTDGGCYENSRRVLWAFIVIVDDQLFYTQTGSLPYSGNHNSNVENAEIESLCKAIDWCLENPSNYEIITDSRAVLDKIEGKVSNATRHPYVKHIQSVITTMNNNPFPMSLVIKWHRRRSNKWMELVDDLCEKGKI